MTFEERQSILSTLSPAELERLRAEVDRRKRKRLAIARRAVRSQPHRPAKGKWERCQEIVDSLFNGTERCRFKAVTGGFCSEHAR